jgi:formate dehydrogenase subunit gamma
VTLGETRADGAVTLESVYCLGLCASGPSALVDGRPVGRLSPDDLSGLGG